jgi:hypothetical protein
MRAGYGESLRKFFIDNTHIKLLIDLGSGVFKSATVDTNILLAKNSVSSDEINAVMLNKNVEIQNLAQYVKNNIVKQKYFKNDLWSILTPIERSIKDKVEKHGIPIKDWPELEIKRGIITGLNEAFIIDELKRQEIINNCTSKEEKVMTEELIRPILRGKDLQKDKYEWAGLFVIFAYFGSHKLITEKLNSIFSHLQKYKSKLMKRGQCRYLSNGKTNDPNSKNYPGYPGMHDWLELDNNLTLNNLNEFKGEKIIYSEIVKSPKFYLDKNGFLPEATTFFMTGSRLEELTNFLNSNHCAWIFTKFYAGGGLGDKGFRYKKEFLEKLPIPKKLESLKDFNSYSVENNFNLEETNYLKKVSDDLFTI